jgi:hypothetical protein
MPTKEVHLPGAKRSYDTDGDAWGCITFAPSWRLVLAFVIGTEAAPWSGVAAYVAIQAPSHGSGPDRSCLDDACVARVSGAHRVP